MKLKNVLIALLAVALTASVATNLYFWQAARETSQSVNDDIDYLQQELADAKNEEERLRLELEEAPTKNEILKLENQVVHNGVIGQEWRQLYYDLFNAVQPSNPTEWRTKTALIHGDPDVWTEPRSSYYHREGCSRLGSVSVTAKLSYAHEQNMSPCPDCEPIVWAAWD